MNENSGVIKINKLISNKFTIQKGVHGGYILLPLLFNIYDKY